MTLEQLAALRNIAANLERHGYRAGADGIRAVLAMDAPEDEPSVPVQSPPGTGVTDIPEGLARLLWPAYGEGYGQTFERMHERGGFGRLELGALAVDAYSELGTQGDGGRHRMHRWPLLDLYEAARRNGGA